MRLDQAIAERFPEISRRKARTLIAEHRIFVNDRPVAVASREVKATDRITVADSLPDLEILRETEDFVAVAKPYGMPTQPDRERKQRSLEELLRVRYREIFLIHRIDTQTTGVVVFARNRASAASLSKLFSTRSIRKTYRALVEGVLADEFVIETPIEAKTAITVVRPIRAIAENTLIEADILTGRTHQIRIHLSSVGHPVVGDRRYGSKISAPRMMLHAWKLQHPSIGELVAPPPPELA